MRPATTFHDVTAYGAVGNGSHPDTKAVQAAVDACHESGGGTVCFPAGGRFLIGTIYLRSHVLLNVEAGAAVLGSTDIADYADDTGLCPYFPEPLDRCLIYARDAVGIGFTGRGVVDGQFADGSLEKDDDPLNSGDRRQRPMLLRLENCSDIILENLTLRGAFSWCVHIKHCDNVKLHGLTVLNDRQDGFNIEGSTGIAVSDCLLRCGDDGIALTTSRRDRPLSGLTVTNCTISSRWAAFRIGPLSKGDFENIEMSNCVLKDCGGGGIKIGMFEGATVRNCVFSSIVMDQVTAPVLIMNARWTDIGSRDPDPPMMPPGKITDLEFSSLIIRAHAGPTPPWDIRRYSEEETLDFLIRPDRNSTIFIHGHRDGIIDSIRFRGVQLELPGAGKPDGRFPDGLPDMHEIDIASHGYWTDDKTICGIPPASAVYARHVASMAFLDVSVRHNRPDERPVVALLDCGRVRLSGFEVDGEIAGPEAVRSGNDVEVRMDR